MNNRFRGIRITAAMVGVCVQLTWAGSGAAQTTPPTESCKTDVTDDDVSVSTNADTDDKKVAEIVAKLEKELPGAFSIPRHENLKNIVTGMTRKMLERKKVVAADLGKGIAAACKALHEAPPQSFEAATAAGYQAADLPVPRTVSANFVTTGSDEAGSQYTFMTGVVNSLEGDGGWKSSLEASFVSQTQFWGPPLESREQRIAEDLYGSAFDLRALISKPRAIGRFEATWSAIGKIDDEQTTDDANPFAAGGGILRLNLGPDLVMGQGWWGVTSGIGFTTRPSEAEDSDVDAARRWYAGLVFLADYGSSKGNAEHVTGRVAIGYSDDKFWEWTETGTAPDGAPTSLEHDEAKRWFLDARIDGPGIFKGDSVKMSLRLFVDHPKSGEGPTDVRISLLVTADLGLLFGK